MIRPRHVIDWPGFVGWTVAVASIVAALVVRGCAG
jgi:hypothetical protein